MGEQKQDGLARLLDPARRMTCPLLTHRTRGHPSSMTRWTALLVIATQNPAGSCRSGRLEVQSRSPEKPESVRRDGSPFVDAIGSAEVASRIFQVVDFNLGVEQRICEFGLPGPAARIVLPRIRAIIASDAWCGGGAYGAGGDCQRVAAQRTCVCETYLNPPGRSSLAGSPGGRPVHPERPRRPALLLSAAVLERRPHPSGTLRAYRRRARALEYNVVRWGKTELPAEAGVAVYVRGQSGKLAAVRIYDDADPPLGPRR
jgi:hypothetical protein